MLIHLTGESLDQKVQQVRDTFYSKFEQTSYPVAASNCYVKEIYDDYVIVENDGSLFKVTYTAADGEITFADRDQWQAVKQEYVNMQKLFTFTELSKDVAIKSIDGLAAGTFTSMSGEEVTFEADELQAYIENTNAVIESTKTESGEIVGLPIDLEAHNHKGGAGWIVGLELDKTRNVIKFIVNWTQKGLDLIKGNLSRFFSPSTDPENKIILGGSLTNWPATRNEKGHILLRPIELSQSIKEIDMDKTVLEMLAELPGKVAEAVRGGKQQEAPAPKVEPAAELEDGNSLRELLQTPEAVEELGQRAQEMAQQAIRVEKRKLRAVEFAAQIAGGTKEKPFGLPVKANEIVALLLSLPEQQAKAVENILNKAHAGAIDFAMHGIDGDGFIQKPQVPAVMKPYVRQWVDAGKDLEGFFRANPELGDPNNYNLAEFVAKGKE